MSEKDKPTTTTNEKAESAGEKPVPPAASTEFEQAQERGYFGAKKDKSDGR